MKFLHFQADGKLFEQGLRNHCHGLNKQHRLQRSTKSSIEPI